MSYSPAEQPDDPKVARELRRIGDAFNTPTLILWNSPPKRPSEGMVVICDGVNWNPIGDGIKRPIWFDMEAQAWKKFV